MAYCTLDATAVKYDGETLDLGIRLNVYKALGNSIIGNLKTAYTFVSAGTWYPVLRFERLSSVYMQMGAGPVSVVEIPDEATAILEMSEGLLTIAGTGAGIQLQQGGNVELEQGGELLPE